MERWTRAFDIRRAFILPFALVGCGGSEPTAGNPAPRVVVEADQDAGVLGPWKAQDIVKDVTVGNEGRSPLEVRILGQSCGCAAFDKTHFTIEPRGKATINVRVKGEKRIGGASVGIRLGTNDPSSPVLDIRVRWTIRSPIEFAVKRIRLDRIDGERYSASCPIKLDSEAERVCEVARLRTWPDQLCATFERSTRPDEFGTLRIHLPIDARIDDPVGWVHLDFDKGDWSESVEVEMPLHRQLVWTPETLVFRRLDGRRLATQLAELRSSESFKVLGWKASSSVVTLKSIDGDAASDRHRFEVGIDLPTGARTFAGHVEVQVATTKPTTVRLPIFAFARGVGQ